MKEINKELAGDIKDYYKKYKSFMNEQKELSDHNKDMKDAFMERHFGEESAFEPFEVKRIKKEVTKYFNTILEIDAGIETVTEIKSVRKSHFNFEVNVYEDLMEVFKQIVENNTNKEDLKNRMEKEVLLIIGGKLGISLDITKGIFKLWKDQEDGKFPVALSVVDDYRIIVREIDKLEE
jgi:hypothetical protein